MRNILAINVSPRKQGTSAMLLGMLKHELGKHGDNVRILHLYSHLNEMQTIFDAVNASDTIVISGPCYTNTYPADTIRLLEELLAQPGVLHGQNLYGIIQGGMPYAHTHISGLNMLKIFSRKAKLPYKGGFVMGFGAMLDGQAINKLLNGKKVERQLMIFFRHIHEGEQSPDSVYEASLLKLPGLVAKLLAAFVNHRAAKTYKARGMNINDPSPYLSDELHSGHHS